MRKPSHLEAVSQMFGLGVRLRRRQGWHWGIHHQSLWYTRRKQTRTPDRYLRIRWEKGGKITLHWAVKTGSWMPMIVVSGEWFWAMTGRSCSWYCWLPVLLTPLNIEVVQSGSLARLRRQRCGCSSNTIHSANLLSLKVPTPEPQWLWSPTDSSASRP